MPKISRSITQLARIAEKHARQIQQRRAKGLPVFTAENTFSVFSIGTFVTGFSAYLFGFWAFLLSISGTIYYILVRGKKASEFQYQSALLIIQNHAQELTSRRAQLTIRKNYGLIDETKWNHEVDIFIGTIIHTGIGDISVSNYERVRVAIWQITAWYESVTPDFSRSMSPLDYERMVSNILRGNGWDARTTKGSGDQGVDVLAHRPGIRVVIQCKLYSKPVGNAAVQEAIAGRAYERADFAAVVTNADFTRSARQLASSANVLLLHHDQLSSLDAICQPMHSRHDK